MVMAIKSAGILLFRNGSDEVNPEVFLVRATTNLRNKELWGVPKGRMEPGEELFETATREFREETGTPAPNTEYEMLPVFKTANGKLIHIYAGNAKTENIKWVKEKVAITTTTRNGKTRYHRETRDGKWFPLDVALETIGAGQKGILTSFQEYIQKLELTH